MNKKLILFMTSLSLAVTPMCVFASEYNQPTATLAAVEERALLKAATGEYRSWKQYDSRWAGMYMSPGTDTLNESGCLVTSIAILMVHSGSADEYGVDPGKLCTYLSNNGGFTSNSELYWSKVNGAVEGFALANYKVSLSGSRYDKAAQIKSYLDQGYYAVVSVGHGAHWVAVDRVDSDGNVYIFDPAYSYTSLFGNYSEEGVTRIAIFSSTGQGQGNIDTGNGEVENFSAKGRVNVGASYLNVRNGMGTDKGYLTRSDGSQVTLQNGEYVTITGKGRDGSGNLWYRISIEGMTGYVSGAYIEIVEEENSGITPTDKQGVVNAASVNIRSGAGTNFSVIAVASQNEEVRVVGETNDSNGALWYKVKYKEVEGFMKADYVTIGDSGNNGNNGSETTYPEKSAKVNASSVNVRSGSGTENSVVATLSLNTPVKVTGEAKDGNGATWYKVKFDGGEGYMHSDYVTIDESGDSGNTGGGTTTEPKKGTVNGDYVNVRSGAGTEHSRVTSLSKGTAVTIIGEEKDSSGATWYKIQYAGGEGYMHSDYVTVGDSGSQGGNPSEEPSYQEKSAKVNANSVNVRSGAGTNNRVVATLSLNSVITVIGEEKDSNGATWYKIRYNGGEGYMLSDYVTIDGSSESGNPGEEPSYQEKSAKVNASSVNVRSGAGTNNSVVATLSLNSVVTVIGEEKDSNGATWYKVKYNGGEGYIHSDYVTIDGSGDSGSTGGSTGGTTTETKKGTVNDDYVNVRSGAGTEHNRVTSLSKGTAVTIIGEEKDSSGATWYKIQYAGGEGYMHSDYITVEQSGSGSTGGQDYPMEGIEGKEGIINAALVNVRSGAGSNCEVITTLKSGVSVLIEDAEKDGEGIIWYRVAFAGTSGYIMAQYIDIQ